MQTILFKLGPISISLFGIFVALGVFTAFFVLKREVKRNRLDENKIMDLATYTVVAGIIGARVYYILVFNLGHYIKNPLEIIMVHRGGLSIQGGLIGAIIFAWIYIKKHNMNFWRIADMFAPVIILGQAIGRIGCDVFGVEMKNPYPWGVEIYDKLMHPAQAYEIILNLILFAVLWNKRDKIKYNGQLFLWYIIGFSLNRGIVEFFRENPLVYKNLSVAHITSIVIITISLIAMFFLRRKNSRDFHKIEKIDTKTKIRDLILIGLLAIVSIFIYYSFY